MVCHQSFPCCITTSHAIVLLLWLRVWLVSASLPTRCFPSTIYLLSEGADRHATATVPPSIAHLASLNSHRIFLQVHLPITYMHFEPPLPGSEPRLAIPNGRRPRTHRSRPLPTTARYEIGPTRSCRETSPTAARRRRRRLKQARATTASLSSDP